MTYALEFRYATALHVSRDIPLGTAFIDRFICGIISAERKVVTWNSEPVVIVARKHQNTKPNVVAADTTKIKKGEHFFEHANVFCSFYCTLSRLEPKPASPCSRDDQIELTSDHPTQNIAINPSMHARSPGCNGYIIWATFSYSLQQLLEMQNEPLKEREVPSHAKSA